MTHALSATNPFIRAIPSIELAGDEWKAICPAHEDRKASLSIRVTDDRHILLHCHAGCATESIVAAVGCKMSDLMPPKEIVNPRIVATYDYRDENGAVIYRRVRYQPKDFRNWQPNGSGGWIKNLNGVRRRVLYRLPELLAAKGTDGIRLIVESEKTADRMAAVGMLVTSCGGAKKWRDEFANNFKGDHVAFLRDNDGPGLKCAEGAAKSLRKAAAASVKVVLLPGLPDNGDPFDWLEAGHTAAEILAEVQAAPEWQAEAAGPPAVTEPTEADAIIASLGPVITNATGDDEQTIPQSMAVVLEGIHKVTDGWPRRVGSSLFVDDPGHGVCRLERENNLFGYLASKARVEWHRVMGCVSRGEVFAELQRTAQGYHAIESYPHFPPRADHYYSHPPIDLGSGDHLRELLSRFEPETEIDRDLILSMIASAVWGGDGGARPAYVISSKFGRGVGKTACVSTAGRLVGGMFAISKDERAADIDKRLLTPDAAAKRVVCLDNVKANALSWPELEARITAREISGHQMYSGERTRPNTLLWRITLNGPSLSKDMAQRSVIVKLGQPTHSGDWEDSLRTFVEANRWKIFADLASFFAQEPAPLAKHTRWGSWEREVLARLPEPAEAQKVIAERQDEVDATDEESGDIEDHFRQQLAWLGYDPETHSVHIPNSIAREWYVRATGHQASTTAVTRAIKQGADEGTLKCLKANACHTYGRGLQWGSGAVYYDIEERLRKKRREQEQDT